MSEKNLDETSEVGKVPSVDVPMPSKGSLEEFNYDFFDRELERRKQTMEEAEEGHRRLGVTLRNLWGELAESEEDEPPAPLVEEVQPPKGALLFMYAFYSRKHRESVMGDMEEDFHEAVELFGLRTARWLYWKNTLMSAPASAKAAIGRLVSAMFGKIVG